MSVITKFHNIKSQQEEYVSKLELRQIMSVVDAELQCRLLHIQITSVRNGQLCGYCPDHHLYKGVKPSDPRWYLNTITGETWCFTEQRASNFVEIVKNLLEYDSLKKAKEYLLNGQTPPTYLELKLKQQSHKLIKKTDSVASVTNNPALASVEKIVKDKYMNMNGYNFFAKNNITPNTVEEFNVVMVKFGRYKNRVIIPFYHDVTNKLCGYIAVSIISKKQWIRSMVSYKLRGKKVNYSLIRKIFRFYSGKFKKVLYCKNSSTGNHLFGLARIINNTTNIEISEPVILVEGERDVMKLQQEGFITLGTHGTHITDEQILLLKKYFSRHHIYIAYDGDEAGKKAANIIYKKLNNEFSNVSILNIKDDKDPKDYDKKEIDELLNKTQGRINELLFNAKSCFSRRFPNLRSN